MRLVLASGNPDKLAEVSKDFPNHFPKGSETGFESEASIKIWQDNAGFRPPCIAASLGGEGAADEPARRCRLPCGTGHHRQATV